MAKQDQRVYSQIEGTADTYEPSVYAMLPLFQDWQLSTDSLGDDYIPLTAAEVPYPAKHKIFVIGLLPPAITVTGRLLDRSASVAALTGAATEAQSTQTAAAAATTTPAPATGKHTPKFGGAHKAAREVMRKAFRKAMGRDPTPAELQYCQAIAWLESSYGQGWKGPMSGSNNWGAVQCPAAQQNAPDCIMYRDTMPGGTGYNVAFRKYATPEDGAADVVKNVMGRGFDKKALGASNPTVYNTSYAMRRGKYYGGICKKAIKQYGTKECNDSFNKPDKNEATQACAKECVDIHAGIVWDTIQDIAAANNEPLALGLGSYDQADAWYRQQAGIGGGSSPVGSDAASNFQDQASAAEDAMKANEKTAFTDLNKTPTGEAFQAAQKRMIGATLEAMERIRNTPPLKLLVNPTSFKVSSSKLIADGNRSRSRVITEHWGEEQDKIDCSGKLAGFFSVDMVGGGNSTNANDKLGASPGLTRIARQYSRSYQNFLSLLLLYKNNGGLWLQDFYEQAVSAQNWFRPMNLSTLGSVYIYYDNTLYIGSFDTLTVNETDTAPYTLEYNFQFTVRATFLLDQVDDPNSGFTYGAAGLLSPKISANRADSVQSSSNEPDPEMEAWARVQAISDANAKRDQEQSAQEARDREEAERNRQQLDALFASPGGSAKPAPPAAPNNAVKTKSQPEPIDPAVQAVLKNRR